MMSFDNYTKLEEAKNYQTLYNFTTLSNLKGIIESDFVFRSSNGHISLTRNFNLPRSAGQIKNNGDFFQNGYVVRFTFDAKKISDNFKLEPILGRTDNSPNIFNSSERIPRSHDEAEETIPFRSGTSLKKYILRIDVSFDVDSQRQYFQEKIERELKDSGIPYHVGRKFNPIREGETYPETELYEEYEI